jgi:hypothetical protein
LPEVQAYHTHNIFFFETVSKVGVPNVTTSGEGQLLFLEMEACVWKLVEITDMIVVQMC